MTSGALKSVVDKPAMELINFIRKRIAIQAVLLLALLLVGGWLSISTLTFWSPDSGLRYWLATEMIHNEWRSIAVDYTARFLDSEWAYVPYYYIYFLVGEEMFLRIPTLFPLIASLLMPIIGRLGLVLPPVVSGVACGLAMVKLARLGGVKQSSAILWTTVLGTPILFYSLEFWDHTFVAAFSLWATYFLAKSITEGSARAAMFGGFLVGISVAERAEYAVYAAALGSALLLLSRLRLNLALAYGTGSLLSILPLSLLQYFWIGNPLGVTYATYGFGYGVPDPYPFSPGADIAEVKSLTYDASRMLTYVEGQDPVTFVATILSVLGLAILVLTLRTPRWRSKAALLTGAAVSVAGYLMWVAVASDTVITGLIPTAAFLSFSVLFVDKADDAKQHLVYRFVLVTTAFFVGVLLLFWPYGGQHWAARYMLPAYPLLLYAAFYSYNHHRKVLPRLRPLLGIAFTSLLVLSVTVQFAGVRLLMQKHIEDSATRDYLQALPAEVIVTNSPFIASEMTSVEKVFIYVADEDNLQTLIPRLWQNDVNTFAIAPLAALPLAIPASVAGIEVQEVQPDIYELRQANLSEDEVE